MTLGCMEFRHSGANSPREAEDPRSSRRSKLGRYVLQGKSVGFLLVHANRLLRSATTTQREEGYELAKNPLKTGRLSRRVLSS